jgi:acetyl esterase/lipase
VIYLHGGAYVADIVQQHWRFIARMADRLGMRFVVPLYPLAPENQCLAVTSFVLGVYRDVLASQGPSRLFLMGDSAGGGLALSLAMQVASAALPKPAGLVLISPWLDVTMTAARQEEIERVDSMLMRPGVRAAGRWYAGSLPTKDPRVSPLFGELVGLPPILMFCGTHDILVADARRLALRAEVDGADIEYHEEPGLMHVYPLLFFPESRKAQDEIARFVSRLPDGTA